MGLWPPQTWAHFTMQSTHLPYTSAQRFIFTSMCSLLHNKLLGRKKVFTLNCFVCYVKLIRLSQSNQLQGRTSDRLPLCATNRHVVGAFYWEETRLGAQLAGVVSGAGKIWRLSLKIIGKCLNSTVGEFKIFGLGEIKKSVMRNIGNRYAWLINLNCLQSDCAESTNRKCRTPKYVGGLQGYWSIGRPICIEMFEYFNNSRCHLFLKMYPSHW